jgi:hypothetical protein
MRPASPSAAKHWRNGVADSWVVSDWPALANHRRCRPDAREIMADFSAIAGADFSYAGNEEDEEALSEIIEFVRVSVLLLYAEHGSAATPARSTTGASRRVH